MLSYPERIAQCIWAIAYVFVLVLLDLGPVVAGPETLAIERDEAAGITTPEKEPVWACETTLDFVTAYVSFGVMQEDAGVIAQPDFNVTGTLYRGDGLINKVTVGLDLWSSIHSAETLAAKNSPVKPWYEFDYFVPLGVTFAERWTFTTTYLEFDFPSGAYTPQRAIQANVEYDDKDLLGRWALHPHLFALYNFDGVLGIAKSHSWFGEAGITPGFRLKNEVSFAFPINVGIGDSHFYPGNAYGFFSSGVVASIPFKSRSRMGKWTGKVGFTYYNFGPASAEFNNGERNAFVGQIGLAVGF